MASVGATNAQKASSTEAIAMFSNKYEETTRGWGTSRSYRCWQWVYKSQEEALADAQERMKKAVECSKEESMLVFPVKNSPYWCMKACKQIASSSSSSY